jgi:DNA-binding NtrC family response regulator
VVDDDPTVAEITAQCLMAGGHQPVVVGNGAQALEQFSSERFDLVITDQAMDGLSGEQLAGAIKQSSPTTPVIMLTGFGDLMKASGTNPEHVDYVVSKPASLLDLSRAIFEVMKA